MILVKFKCPSCKAEEQTTWITDAGHPYCPCNVARIYGDTAVKAIERSAELPYVKDGMADLAETSARTSAHYAFDARPDLRILAVGV